MAPDTDPAPLATVGTGTVLTALPRRSNDRRPNDIALHGPTIVTLRTAEAEAVERLQASRRQHPARGTRDAPVDAA